MGQRSNLEIAHFLERYARLLSIEDERGFRARAMTRAAESIRAFPGNVAEEAAAGRLQEIDHVGSGIAAIVQDYLEKGSSPVVDETERRVPQESLALLSIPGLGPKTVRKLVIDLGITSPDRLKDAVEQGLITADSGFNARTQSAILSGLEWLAEHSGRTPLGTALPVARQLISDIETALQGSVTISLAGSLRRLEETAGDINLVATSSDIAELLDGIQGLSAIQLRPDNSEYHFTGTAVNGISVTLQVVDPSLFGSELVKSSSRPAHLELLGRIRGAATEEEVYADHGLPWISPELRTGDREIELARSGEIERLVRLADIRGDLHSHTTWSDGTESIETMARAAADRGYLYLGITDHSRGLGIANGLDVDRLKEQRSEIDHLNRANGILILAGSEVEVHGDGRLDFVDEVLSELDVVVASTHSGLRKDRASLTERLVRVLRNRHVDIIAHPSGRLIGRRAPGDFDWPVIFEEAAKTGTALEINCDPARLDLSSELARAAIEADCTLTINCDAHRPSGFDNLEFGIANARRAYATSEQIINTWEPERLTDWLRSRSA